MSNTTATQLQVIITAPSGSTLINGPVQVTLTLNGTAYSFSITVDCAISLDSTKATSGPMPISMTSAPAGKYNVQLHFPSSNVSGSTESNFIQLNLLNSDARQILSNNFVAPLNTSIYDTGVQPINTLGATTASAIAITATIALGTFTDPSVPIFINLQGVDSPSYNYNNYINCVTNPSGTQTTSAITPIDFAIAEQYKVRTFFASSHTNVTTARVAIKVDFYNATNELLFSSSSQAYFILLDSTYDTGNSTINTLGATSSNQARITLIASPTQISVLAVPVTLYVMGISSSLYDYQTQIICNKNPSNAFQAISVIVPVNQILLGSYTIQMVVSSTVSTSSANITAELELFNSNSLQTFDQIYSTTQLMTGEYDTGPEPITIASTTTTTKARIISNITSGTFNGQSVPIILALDGAGLSTYTYFTIIYCGTFAGSTNASSIIEQIGSAPIGSYLVELFFDKNYVNPGTSTVTIELQLFNSDTVKLFDTIFPAPFDGNIYDTGVQLIDIVVTLMDIITTTTGTFIGSSTLAGLLLDSPPLVPILLNFSLRSSGHTAFVTKYPIYPPLPVGTTTLDFFFFTNTITPAPPTADVTTTIVFKDLPGNTLGTAPNKSMPSVGSDYRTGAIDVSIACLHGDSIVQSREGPKKIKDVQANDAVMTGENRFARVLNLAQCWIKMTKEPAPHDAIIFEPNSLGEGEPSERLIIDPGHPMATKAEFEKHGLSALKRAGEYLGTASEDLIYIRKWDDPIIQTDSSRQSIRYDLILEEPHETYITNGVVVKSRKSVKDPGYLHRYDDFV